MTQLDGGDDYQLAFTTSSENHRKLKQFAADQSIQLTKIGHIINGSELVLQDSHGATLKILPGGTSAVFKSGFSHFGIKK